MYLIDHVLRLSEGPLSLATARPTNANHSYPPSLRVPARTASTRCATRCGLVPALCKEHISKVCVSYDISIIFCLPGVTKTDSGLTNRIQTIELKYGTKMNDFDMKIHSRNVN